MLSKRRLLATIMAVLLAVTMLPALGGGQAVHADNPAIQFVGSLDMGKLTEGYSKEAAQALKKDIVIKNNAEQSFVVNKNRFYFYRVDDNEFKYTLTIGSEDVTVEPGETLKVGTIQPQHQVGAGTYRAPISVWSKIGNEEITDEITATYTVETTGTDMYVSYGDNDEFEGLEYGPSLVGNVAADSDTFNITNIGQKPYKLTLTSSDSDLFAFDFVNEEDDGRDIANGETVPVIVTLNVDKANELDPGDHSGNLKITAASADGESVEKSYPIDFRITDMPAWKTETREETAKVGTGRGYYLETVNTESFDSSNRAKYLKAVLLDEGTTPDCFYLNREGALDYEGDAYLRLNSPIQKAGEYQANVKLLYDRKGQGDFTNAEDLGTCQFKLTVQEDPGYGLSILNDYEGEQGIYLGVLSEGYTEEDIEAHRQAVVVKNESAEGKALNMSPAGLTIDREYSDDPDAFVVSSSTETTGVASGQIYDKAWVKPAPDQEPGVYWAELNFADNDSRAEDSVSVVYIVGEEGLHAELEEVEIFEDSKPIGPDGIDFGADQPGLAPKTTTKHVLVTNTGTTPFYMDASKVDGGSDAFTVEASSSTRALEPGDYRLMSVRLNTESIADTQGIYTATARINLVNADDNKDTQTIDVPLRYEVTQDAVANVTLNFQGKGNGEYQNTTMEFKKGTSYRTVVKKLVAQATGQDPRYDVQWPTDNEYTVVGFTGEKDEDLHSWDELRSAQEELLGSTVSGDATVYINWAQKINKVSLTVEPPKSDAVIGAPKVTLQEDVPYKLYKDNTFWYKDKGEVKFKAGGTYDVRVSLDADFGYSFAKDCSIRINGKKADRLSKETAVSSLEAGTSMQVEDHHWGSYQPISEKMHKRVCMDEGCGEVLREEHRWDDGTVTTEPECEEPGEMTYVCEDCGWERYEPIEPIGHDYETTLVKPATDDEYGWMDFECKTCGETDSAWFGYSCTDGDGSVWYKGSARYVRITFERFTTGEEEENCFREIKIDDTIYPDDATREYGISISNQVETEISLPPSILEKLSEGEHTLTILYEDGYATAKFSVKEAKVIDTVELTIKPPVCGEEASNQWNERKGEVIVNPPQVSFDANADYKQGTLFRNRWTDANSSQYWSGTFKGGETQYAYVYLEPKEGAVFKLQESESSYNPVYAGVVRVNGQMVIPVKATAFVDGVRFLLPINAEHVWDEGKVTKEPTTTSEGEKTYTCAACGDTKTEVIPKSGADPTQMGEDGTALGKGASAAAAENAILGMTSDADPAGSKCAPILLRATKRTKKALTLSWKKVTGAKKYVIYGNACGKKNKMKKLATVTSNRKKIARISKKLKKATYYKFIVVALDENNNVVSTSKVIHASTAGSKKKANPKAVKVTAPKKARATVAVGKTVKIKAKATKAKGSKVKKHRALSYESLNPDIATVSRKGVIKGVKKGNTTVYAYAQNGYYKAVKVTVK